MLTPEEERRILDVAEAIGDLVHEAVFVGGAITALLVTDAAAPAVRPTDDVDLLVNAKTRVKYYDVEAKVRARGFVQRSGEPICRWFKDGLVVDLMPDDETILGFSNRWYGAAFAEAVEVLIGTRHLRVIGPVWFLATKLEAFQGRGDGDFLASHDMEDVVTVLDGRPSIVDEIAASPADVLDYIQGHFRSFLENEDFVVSLEGHTRDPGRAVIVEDRMRAIIAS